MVDVPDDACSPDAEVARAWTIPSSWYLDPSRLGAEIEHVFAASWQWVGGASVLDAPGRYRVTEVAGEPLLLVRDRDGQLRALSNVCRHRAGPVAEGCGTARALTCGYHGWRYSLDGRLAAAREMGEVRDFDPSEVRLPTFELAEWAGQLFVRVEAQGPSLAETLGEVVAEVAELDADLSALVTVARRDYEVASNWKVYVDNYLEGYHLPFVHPGLSRVLDAGRYRVVSRRWHSRQHAPFRDGRIERALYYWIFPNLMLNVYPDNIQANLVEPLGHERTRVVFEWFARPDGDPARLDEAMELADEVQAEDAAVCEAVQRGLRSRTYDRGRYSAVHEGGVHHFHQLLRSRLG